jgi:hypothetical protein
MNIPPHWVAVIGVLAGALIAAGSGFLASYIAYRRDLSLRRRDEKLRKYEEIYERLSKLHATVSSAIMPASFELMQGRVADVAKKIDAEHTTKLDALVGLYAPEIAGPYEKVRERSTKLLVNLFETSLAVAQQRSSGPAVAALVSGLHDLAGEVLAVQKEIVRLARAHDL